MSKFRSLGWIISPLYLLVVVYIPIVFGFSYNEVIRYGLGTSSLAWFAFFYLGFMLGNKLIAFNIGNKAIVLMLISSIIIQIAEAQCLYSIGEIEMCGTQQKLTAYLTSAITCLLCHNLASKKYAVNKSNYSLRLLISIGDCSFGIYLIHILIRDAIRYVIGIQVSSVMLFAVTLTISYLIVLSGRKYLPKI